MSRPRPVVAIDGPAGAGKSTVARGVARALGYVLIDTGALYRTVALAARARGVAFGDRAGVEAVAHEVVATGALAMAFTEGTAQRITLDGRDVGAEIRTPELSMAASTVSAYPEVRAALLNLQRVFGAQGGVVLEGRDIGTVVFPDAELKVFLTATPEQRADRRFRELRERGDTTTTLAQTLAEVHQRDQQDSERKVAPLRAASDAVMIDSSAQTPDEVIAAIVALARLREHRAPG